ncbi:uncharacterized protein LOC114468191 isoform X2 [Gouania willdenowi]|uniref:uncharacterized protein LOC114468191 isoform X2 n=1 Tax=Gouania willdenowi TaxID=441366 RepID=UPI001054F0C5|nr:uncharacterized protein LOC114468191 isoform X2 [Gouania willdenowi]
MLSLKPTIVVFWIYYCLIQVSGTDIKNITCHDIKTNNGYKYTHNCVDKEISVINLADNIVIANIDRNEQQKLDYVKEINETHIILKTCLSIKVECSSNGVSGYTSKTTIFRVSKTKEREGNSTSTDVLPWIIGILVTILIIILSMCCICCIYCWWKKSKKQNLPLTFSGFMTYLRTGFCFRTRSLPESGSNHSLGSYSRREVQGVSADLEETGQNGGIRTPREHGENDPEHVNRPESVQIHRSYSGCEVQVVSADLEETGQNGEIGSYSGREVQVVSADLEETGQNGEISIDFQSDGNTARPRCLESSLSNKHMLPTEKDLDLDDEEEQQAERRLLLSDQGGAISCGTMALVSNPPSDTDVPKRASTAAA